jgi:two-component system, NtrC family, sensor kinase
MQGYRSTSRLIRLAMAGAILFPTSLFSYGAWTAYRNIHALADERLVRSLDVQEEEAAKTFELITLTFNNTIDAVSGMSLDDIRRNEERLHQQLSKYADAIDVVQSVWIYDTNGKPLVTSRSFPAPETSYADRDFVRANVAADVGTYIGQVYASSLGGQPYFTVSRRLLRDGEFVGIVEISVLPSNFFRFYSALAYTRGLQYALVRADGLFLARYPSAPNLSERLGPQTGFARTVAGSPNGGAYSSTSPIDGVNRRYIIRKLLDGPIYLTAGIENATLRYEWLTTMGAHLIFGVPATLGLFFTLWTILNRTKRLQAEIEGRAAAEEALRQSQKLEAVGHLTGGIAHDFNNLLTIIIGNLEGAQRQLDGAVPRLKERIDNAMHGAQRAATLTKRLLAFSRQQPLTPSPLDVNRLMAGLSDFLQRSLGEQIALEVVGGPGLWPVEVDAAELESTLVNLAVNARDAMPAGGKLTIEAGNSYLDDAYCRVHEEVRPGQYVMIAVTDTGAGMSKEIRERAFEPFFTTKQSGHGTGLGLSQVYGFVKQSGGHVKIYSEIGEGTTVRIYLPRHYGETRIQEDPAIPYRSANGSERVLVVEDDADVRIYIVETLSAVGYRVDQASTGRDALKLIGSADNNFDLLLTDVVMPGMNGRQLADEARKLHPELKVVFMTGYSRNAIVHQGRLDPGVDLLQKPLTSYQLTQMVRSVLDQTVASPTPIG